MKKALCSTFFFLLLVGIDILTKAAALKWIPPSHGSEYPFGGIGVFQNFLGMSCSLNTIVNTGAAWGIFPHHTFLLLTIRAGIVALLVAYILFGKAKHRLFLWLIVTGAIGNIIDMVYYGYVIDFVHVRILGWSFPIFNFADACITIGVALLVLWPQRSGGPHEN